MKKCVCLMALVLTVLVVPVRAEIADGLINLWSFEETEGLVAADAAGLAVNDATWDTTTGLGLSWGSGMIGGAAVLTGERRFNVGAAEMAGATQLSFSYWIKPDLAQDNNAGIFTGRGSTVLRTGGVAANQFWGHGWNSNTKVRCDSTGSVYSNDIYTAETPGPFWTHVVWTWDGEGGSSVGQEPIAIYVNGVLQNTVNINCQQYISGNWVIGGDTYNYSRSYSGLIDDLAVWDEVLDATAIAKIYSDGLQGISVPEPATMILLGLGSLVLVRRK